MLLEIIVSHNVRKNGRPVGRPCRKLLLKCDHCGNEFTRSYLKSYAEHDIHTCSYACNNRCDLKKEKTRKTCFQKFGVESAMRSDEVKMHHKKTMKEKYGVEYACQIPHVQKLSRTPEALKKRHFSKLQNGTYRKSHLEIELFQLLRSFTNVSSQCTLFELFSVDMKLEDFDCFIQFDGVHWHGLDRSHPLPLESKHWRIISGKFDRDRELDSLVFQSKKGMIRVTDAAFKSNKQEIVGAILNLAAKSDWSGTKYMGEHFETFNLR